MAIPTILNKCGLHGGQQPVGGARIYLMAAGQSGYGGAAGSSTTPTYVTYLQQSSAQSAAVTIGASIKSVTYKGGHLHVAMACPAVVADKHHS